MARDPYDEYATLYTLTQPQKIFENPYPSDICQDLKYLPWYRNELKHTPWSYLAYIYSIHFYLCRIYAILYLIPILFCFVNPLTSYYISPYSGYCILRSRETIWSVY